MGGDGGRLGARGGEGGRWWAMGGQGERGGEKGLRDLNLT